MFKVFGRLFNSSIFLTALILVLLPWTLQSITALSSPETFLPVPLDSNPFELVFRILGNHRMTFSLTWLPTVLTLLSFSGLFIIAYIFILTYLLSPNGLRLLASSALIAFIYAQGQPGTSPESLLVFALQLTLIAPFFKMPSGILIWIFVTVGVLISSFHEAFQFPLLWFCFSFVSGFIIHYLIAEKTYLPRKFRRLWMEFFPLILGFGLLFFWALSHLMTMPINWTLAGPSPLWPLAWLLTGLNVVLCLKNPSQTFRWLSSTCFAHGLFFSRMIEVPVILLIIFTVLEALVLFPQIIQRISPKILKVSSGLALLAIYILICNTAYSARHIRSLDTMWLSVLNRLSTTKPVQEGQTVLVVGSGLPLLATFLENDIIRDDESLLLTSEAALINHLKEENIGSVIIEKKYFNAFWQNWISSGQPPEIGNKSVLSRMMIYEGKEVSTSTINVSEIKRLKIEPLKGLSDRYLLLRVVQ